MLFYSFDVNLDRFVGSCNAFSDLSNKICVPNKTKDLNLNVFNTRTGINELKVNKTYYVSANVSLVVKTVTQIKSGKV